MQDSGVETPEGNGIMGSRRAKAHPIQMLKCPRCDSLNTKFCYYNNYNLAQPRHFCKNCRRYWTKGGALRNVPVGGGCRKNKRSTKQLRKVCPTNLGGSSGAGPSATVHQRGSDTGFDSHCDIGTDNPAITTSGTSTDAISGLNFTGISASAGAAGSLDFQLKQDQLLLLGNFIDANSYSVNESGYFPLSDPATSAVNWNAVDSRKGFGLSEMQRKQTSLPHGDVQPAASIKIEEGEEASRVVMGNAPALSLWDAEGGNGVFPYNFDYNGEALLEMQIGDLGCWGGGGW